jgi:RHS repeat-associated protein
MRRTSHVHAGRALVAGVLVALLATAPSSAAASRAVDAAASRLAPGSAADLRAVPIDDDAQTTVLVLVALRLVPPQAHKADGVRSENSRLGITRYFWCWHPGRVAPKSATAVGKSADAATTCIGSNDGARWMSPGVGRFASVDPAEGNPKNPATLHPYLYGRANPVRFVDPTGRDFTLSETQVTVAAVAVLSAVAYAMGPGKILTGMAAEYDQFNNRINPVYLKYRLFVQFLDFRTYWDGSVYL